MLRIHRRGFAFLLLAVASAALAAETADTPNPGVQITSLPDRLRVDINGRLFTEYFFKEVPRPYCYPLIGPGQLPMTRNWPMKTVPDEDRDHPHHRSFWYSHGAVNGVDFWSEQGNFGRIRHEKFLEVTSGRESGLIHARNLWTAPGGKVVCVDERKLRFYATGDAGQRSFDFEITLQALDEPVVLGDTKEGTMAVRLAETMRLKGKVGQGHIVNSAGQRDDQTWGKRAEWCDYHGPVEGKTVGLAILDHPKNPRHPTWWHVRDYGLFAANPFGRHDFEKFADKTAGDLRIPAGQGITFRYRFILHAGDEKEARIAEQYATYAKTISATH
jgi:hypothetical protein